MKITTLFIVTGLVAYLAGLGGGIGFDTTALLDSAGILAATLVVAGLPLGFSVWKLKKSRDGLAHTLALPDLPLSSTGIAEADALARQFQELLQAAQQAASEEHNELQSVHALLSKVDRRNLERDADGKRQLAADRLRSILRGHGNQLNASLKQAVAAGREINRATEQIVSGSEIQSDSANRTTDAVQQLSHQIMSICDHSESALTISTEARDTARERLAEFEELIEEISNLRNQAASRERRFKTLGQHTKDIETIVESIGHLSSRTDLLALNASIESVRAGQQGRGFAIVAEEVRTLAEQSAQAALDITSRLEMIQLETHQSLTMASEEHDQLQQLINRVTRTLDSLQQIGDTTDHSVDRLADISNSAGEQLRLAQKIVAAMEDENTVCQQNRSRAEGASWTSKSLTQINEKLEASLEFYRQLGGLTDAPMPAEYLESVTPASTNPIPVSMPINLATPVGADA